MQFKKMSIGNYVYGSPQANSASDRLLTNDEEKQFNCDSNMAQPD